MKRRAFLAAVIAGTVHAVFGVQPRQVAGPVAVLNRFELKPGLALLTILKPTPGFRAEVLAGLRKARRKN